MFYFHQNTRYQMPVLFGGFYFNPNDGAIASDVSLITIALETTPQALEPYLPAGFTLQSPTINFEYLQLRDVDILTGGGYNIAQVTLPVHFEGRNDSLDGILPLVIWENDTIPILGGREYSGMPKIYADISDMNSINGTYFANASFNGNTFLTFNINNLTSYSNQEDPSMQNPTTMNNTIGIRYIPKVGAPGADLIQTIAYPQAFTSHEIYAGTGSIELTLLPPYKDLIHTRIIEQLSNLPIKSTVSAYLIKASIAMKSLRCRVIY